MMVRDKPGHCLAVVSIQPESCEIRTLISCSHNSTVVGYQQSKVTSRSESPSGKLSSSEDRDLWCCMAELVVSMLVLQWDIHMWEVQ